MIKVNDIKFYQGLFSIRWQSDMWNTPRSLQSHQEMSPVLCCGSVLSVSFEEDVNLRQFTNKWDQDVIDREREREKGLEMRRIRSQHPLHLHTYIQKEKEQKKYISSPSAKPFHNSLNLLIKKACPITFKWLNSFPPWNIKVVKTAFVLSAWIPGRCCITWTRHHAPPAWTVLQL